MYRWTFYFDEGTIVKDILPDESEAEIYSALYSTSRERLIKFGNDERQMHVNLNFVKLAVREKIEIPALPDNSNQETVPQST